MGVYVGHLPVDVEPDWEQRQHAFDAAVEYLTKEYGIPADEAGKNLRVLVGEFNKDGELDLAAAATKLTGGEQLDASQLWNTFADGAQQWLVGAGIKAVLGWLGKLVLPGAAVLQLVYSGVSWVIKNKDTIGRVLQKAFGLLGTATQGAAAVARGGFDILGRAVGLLLKLIGELLRLNKVADAVQAIFVKLKMLVWDWARKALASLLRKSGKKALACPVRKPGKTPAGGGNRYVPKLGCRGKCFRGITPLQLPGGPRPIREECAGRRTLAEGAAMASMRCC